MSLNPSIVKLILSRLSPLLILLILISVSPACHRRVTAPPIRTGPEGSPLVRVRLLNRAQIVNVGGGAGGVLISDAESGNKIAAVPAGGHWDVLRFGPAAEIRVAMPDGRVSQPHRQGVKIEALGAGAFVELGKQSYRGELYIYPGTEGLLMVVNSLPLEQYLRSVVPAEMGGLDIRYLEAMKAQAVASRSYAMSLMGRNQQYAFDLTADTGDQVYKGLQSENPVSDQAVMETAGECLTYRSRVITAFYHSTSGGRTADPEEVWGKQFADSNPYLKSVEDDRLDLSSKWNNWTITWTRQELLEGIKRTLPALVGLSPEDIGEPTDIEVLEKGPSGRSVLLKVTTEKRVLQIKGDQIRSVLRQPEGSLLPSTLFDLTVENNAGGTVIVASGKGYGHGLGLCQTSARARADDGEAYTGILKHYYRGVSLVKLF